MAKTNIHEFTVRIRFNKPITRADAKREVKDVAEFSYSEHYTSWGDTDEGYPATFKVKAVK